MQQVPANKAHCAAFWDETPGSGPLGLRLQSVRLPCPNRGWERQVLHIMAAFGRHGRAARSCGQREAAVNVIDAVPLHEGMPGIGFNVKLRLPMAELSGPNSMTKE